MSANQSPNHNRSPRIMAPSFVSDANFEQEVLKSSEPVLVDFFAEWCGPCKAMAPALDEVAQDMAGKVKITKIDVDENPEITNKYQIQAMPTLILFKDGEVAARHTGALVQKSKLEAWIKESV
ncbi:MAG: thioredoxin [Hyphomicrobiaceae bacterium]